ncbi:cupin [Agromyces rhizosphaerae]|uniref:Cupin n=1 Tax=Agromyces rhizosphaerae TaxID=88374 RepID=A0A9W6FQX0_9MICO|nr:cupin domain-containing protein [Agromyces rhizosphaerae]GLI26523.1 cupin [Agromyces rhizosphaerae]
MRIISGRSGAPSGQAANTFTGEVWADGVVTDRPDVKINNVIFTPCARTYWHSHEGGQILQVFRGRGLVTGGDGETRVITEGDTVWIEPGERHWHGGTVESLMGHTAISLGTTTWLEEVSEADYAAAQG